MFVKNLILVILTSILFSGCSASYGQDKEIIQFVKKVIKTYSEKNSEKFNQLINDKVGLVCITTIGSNNYWSKVEKVCLDKNCLQTGLANAMEDRYQVILETYTTGNLDLNKIEFTEQSYFECEKIEKQGIFVSSENKFHTLSQSVSFFMENAKDIIGEELDQNKRTELEKDLEDFQKLELKSRRVTVNSDGGTIIFYMTNLENKWYLTLIDFASMDCSV